MAGSYNHVVGDDGKLRSPKEVCNMLNLGGSPEAWGSLAARDVCEAIEEMYGMIWWLAHSMASEDRFDPSDYEEMKAYFIEEASKNYREGLEKSPGVGPGWNKVGPWIVRN